MDDIMNQGGGKSALGALKPGDEIAGIIVSEPQKKADLDANGVQRVFQKSGELRWVWLVTIQTNLQDDAEDDGLRTLWLSWKSLTAFVQAVREGWVKAGRVGNPRPEVGGLIVMRCTGSQKTGFGSSETKSWAAAYTPPDAPAATVEMMSTPTSPAQSYNPPPPPLSSAPPSPLAQTAAAQSTLMQQMRDRAAARAAAVTGTPGHHGEGEPPF